MLIMNFEYLLFNQAFQYSYKCFKLNEFTFTIIDPILLNVLLQSYIKFCEGDFKHSLFAYVLANKEATDLE